MKVRNLFLFAMSAGLLLSGCAGNKANNSSSIENESSSSIDTASEDSEAAAKREARRAALGKFITKIAPNNLTMTLSSAFFGSTYTYSYMGADAFFVSDGESTSGVLVNGEQGFYAFSFDKDGKVELNGCNGLGNDVTQYFTTPSTVFTDSDMNQYYVLDGDGLTIKLDTKSMKKDLVSYKKGGVGTTCLYYLMSLCGMNTNYYNYVSSAKITLAEDSSSADLVLRLNAGGQIISVTASFSNIGTTTNQAVADYIANPTTLTAPTDWSEESKKAIDAVFTEHASDVVFPTGLVTCAWADEALVYSSSDDEEDEDSSSESSESSETATTEKTPDYAGIQWTHYGKNLTKKYGAMLTKAGYKFVGSEKSSSDYYTHYYYQKEIVAQTNTKGATYIEVDFYYYSSTSEFTCQIYTADDAIRYEYATVSEANAKIAAVNALEKVEYDVPSLIESDKIDGSIEFADYTGLATYKDSTTGKTAYYDYYYMVTMDFKTKEDCSKYGSDYIATIGGKYKNIADLSSYYSSYTWENGKVVYVVVDNDKNILAELTVAMQMNADKTYTLGILASC